MKRNILTSFFLAVGLIAIGRPAIIWATPLDTIIFSENFSGDLADQWIPLDGVGTVSIGGNDVGLLTEIPDINTLLFAWPILADAGTYRYEFDYMAHTSDNGSNVGTFADFFTGSLGFDTLLEVDATTETTYLGASLGSTDSWTHLVFDFEVTQSMVDDLFNDVTPWFTLADQNGILGDSFVYLDNVVISQAAAPVPEPATLVLLGAGLGGLSLVRRKGN